MRVLLESPLKSFLSNKGPQASEEDILEGINRLGYYYKVEYYSFKDTESSKDTRTWPLKEGITLFDYSLRSLQVY